MTPPLSREEINRFHGIGTRPSTTRPGPRLVILKLVTYKIRIFRKHSLLRHSSTPVYINEDLTKTKSQLLWKARGLMKSGGISDCLSHYWNSLIKKKQPRQDHPNPRFSSARENWTLNDVCAIMDASTITQLCRRYCNIPIYLYWFCRTIMLSLYLHYIIYFLHFIPSVYVIIMIYKYCLKPCYYMSAVFPMSIVIASCNECQCHVPIVSESR